MSSLCHLPCRYHYYGIAIKETSPYFHCVYSRNGLTRCVLAIARADSVIVGTPLYSEMAMEGRGERGGEGRGEKGGEGGEEKGRERREEEGR